ncbi:MAG: roadblock/LC7 domain-containing protein [Bradymonadales bacterium]|nr:roadblock/LC7 domain-containing protein [Bradymonadales bacterium]
MANPQMVLYEEEQRLLTTICGELLHDSLARAIFLVDKNGQLITGVGELAGIDTTALASLVAGTVAATGGLAKLIGQEEFPVHVHEGENRHICLSLVGQDHILTVIFDERSSLGLVRLRVKKSIGKMLEVFEQMRERAASSEGDDFFAEITDEDIESLFSDSF